MPWPDSSVVDVLAEECDHVSRVVLTLSPDAFETPTRCEAWNVKELLGHMYRDVDRLIEYRGEPAPAEPDADAVSYWRRYDPVDDSPGIAHRAIEIAKGFETGADLARAFEVRWREAVNVAKQLEPDRIYRTFAPAMRLDEYVKTRVLEIVVHGLDLARAIGRPPWISPRAADVTRHVLLELLGAEPPRSLGWDEVTFIETATGRRPLSPPEQEVLGERTERFPLLT
jgi:uncharacterized protein (TIGR03083 family)